MTADEEANENLLEQLKIIDSIQPEKKSICNRLSSTWKSVKLKAALAHIGLMLSLSIYCVVGGLVSILFISILILTLLEDIEQ